MPSISDVKLLTELKDISTHNENNLFDSVSTTMTPATVVSFTTEPSSVLEANEDEIIEKPETLLETFQNGKLMKFFKFLTSSYFVYLLYGIVFSIHLIIYLGIGIGDYFTFTTGGYDNLQNKKQAFVVDTFIFSTGGCGTGSRNQTIFLTFLGVYAAIGLLFAVVSMFMKRDLWKVKLEIVFTEVNWVIFALAYGIPSLRSEVTTL